MPTPIRSIRLSDEAMAFIQEMAEAYGSADAGLIAARDYVKQGAPGRPLEARPGVAYKTSPDMPPGPNGEQAPGDKGFMIGEVDPILEAPPAKKKAETVAERKQQQAKEHAAALAEADVVARAVGRDDIDYDLENTAHRNVLHVGQAQQPVGQPRNHYPVRQEKVRPLTRPHGSTEAKRKREQ